MRIPQLRILATSFCGRKCLYCRPSGEGIMSCSSSEFINLKDAIDVCTLYKKNGGTEVKITGGDPVFWPDLAVLVRNLKENIGMEKVEVITRSPRVVKIIDNLIESGLDVLNFSLDVVKQNVYEGITGCHDYHDLINAIRECSKILPVKINSVIMRGINK